jgi:two-component system, OmpR family, response regulator
MNNVPAKVLIIDDDQAVTETFARILRLEGHEVRTAHDAESGLHEAQATPPDAIIVDLRMPLINGLGFLYRLRADARFQQTPVAIVTGDYCVDDSIARELTELGAQLHFKPLWLEDLVELAYALLTSNRPKSSSQSLLN